MPTKRELQQELEEFRKRLHDNVVLMNRAAVKAEDMMALQQKYEDLQQKVRRLKGDWRG
jgi:hypothetical protein